MPVTRLADQTMMQSGNGVMARASTAVAGSSLAFLQSDWELASDTDKRAAGDERLGKALGLVYASAEDALCPSLLLWISGAAWLQCHGWKEHLFSRDLVLGCVGICCRMMFAYIPRPRCYAPAMRPWNCSRAAQHPPDRQCSCMLNSLWLGQSNWTAMRFIPRKCTHVLLGALHPLP